MKYRKKAVEIEAVHFTGDGIFHDLKELGCPVLFGNALFPSSLKTEDGRKDTGYYIDPGSGNLVIRTMEGDMHAPLGWWIIKGVAGEFYPCRDDIFQQTYEEVA